MDDPSQIYFPLAWPARGAAHVARPGILEVERPDLRTPFVLRGNVLTIGWVQYRGHFLQLKPQKKRYGPTQAKALLCEWEDGVVEY